LAFSKELLPVGSRIDDGTERPRAVSEYLVERLIAGGATRICFIIAPGKSDILHYFGGSIDGVPICYAVQERPAGLCDAIFRALPLTGRDESVVVGLPDTIWFPVGALRSLPDDALSFLLFPVDRPELFDAVITDRRGQVASIDVKKQQPGSSWVWGAFKAPVPLLSALSELWKQRDCRDEYIGTLVNAYLQAGGTALGVRAGEIYVDVGTVHGYREAVRVLGAHP
jgi:dTDP-glucose pyrophosphorylase